MTQPGRQALLTEGPIARTLLWFALPILGGTVLQSLNASVNAMWIGHFLGEAALTATSNATLILFLLLSAVFGVSMASTILVGQSLGARDLAEAKRVVGTGVGFFVAISVAVAVAGYLATPALLRLLGTPADAQPYASAYLRIIFVALPSMYFYNFLMMTLRGAGDSRTPFLFMGLSVLLDIGLNPLFIFGVGPFPRLGIAGSATATLIAQSTALLALLATLRLRRHFLWIGRRELALLKPDWTILRALVFKGLPMGLQMIVISASAIVMMKLVNAHGSQTVAAYGAATQLWTYVQMPAMAIGAAVSSMAAQNVGARRWDRVARIAGAGVAYNFLLGGALIGLVYLCNRAALGLFLPGDAAALGLAEHLNAIAVWSFLFFGVTFVLFGVVRSTGAVWPPLFVLLVTLWFIRPPFALLLQPRMGADAIWWSFPLGSLASMLLALGYYRFGRWRQAHMLEPAPVQQAPSTGQGVPAGTVVEAAD
ncbi:MATE family efflux transporter [Fulvimonas soli]|uniref:Putative MATE family efflux protein n=1 Tax=Fulvimonas soli TaxID=155197 RepID=A0A316IYZ4_9GAMM|nr:MATE family efflux transporter [Fulvimonas soli]PWK92465.1 putative MATE family efflux protein [Fulvimonas soli]TNY25640.1 MATE family efflux transporter [Fulvimonas soli]